eukprot:2548491-Rhodomonas_salina.1
MVLGLSSRTTASHCTAPNGAPTAYACRCPRIQPTFVIYGGNIAEYGGKAQTWAVSNANTHTSMRSHVTRSALHRIKSAFEMCILSGLKVQIVGLRREASGFESLGSRI